MKIFRVGIIALTFILLSSLVYAGPKGKGQTKGGQAVERPSPERIGKETAETVVDVLTGEDTKTKATQGGTPPGLAKKDEMPKGLEKKSKTPSGWSKGEKKGWDKTTAEKEDSPIRKFIKGLFGKKE